MLTIPPYHIISVDVLIVLIKVGHFCSQAWKCSVSYVDLISISLLRLFFFFFNAKMWLG